MIFALSKKSARIYRNTGIFFYEYPIYYLRPVLFCLPSLSYQILMSYFGKLLQAVITMINHAIGASGVVGKECKAVVQQYGRIIMDLLSSGVIN